MLFASCDRPIFLSIEVWIFQVVRSEKVSVKDTMERDNKAVKKPDSLKEKSRNAAAMDKPEPIQLPPSIFKVG